MSDAPRVLVRDGGDLLVMGLGPSLWGVLQEVPEILGHASASDDVRLRLFPDVYDDERANENWRRHAQPEIAALFASARELVASDLKNGEREGPRKLTWKLPIPAAHHTAWMSALNAARLALGVLHSVTETDLNRLRDESPVTYRDFAVLRIHFLGLVEELLVSAASNGDG